MPQNLSYVMADEDRLKQVLINLLSNAIKFTDDGLIKVTAEMSEETTKDIVLKISISDTGIEITPEMQPTFSTISTRRQFFNKKNTKEQGLDLLLVKALLNLWMEQ